MYQFSIIYHLYIALNILNISFRFQDIRIITYCNTYYFNYTIRLILSI